MSINPYFNKNYSSTKEQKLYDDLMTESIQIHGIDVVYLPREIQKINSVFQDVDVSRFTETYDIEMFVDTINAFDGEGDFLSKFGVQIRDSLELTVMVKRFETLNIGKPKEGDLIFFPFTKQLFEIMFVEHEQIFYTLGEKFVYKIKMELFEYSNQIIETGIEDIDNTQYQEAYSIQLPVVSSTGDFTVGQKVFQGDSYDSAIARGTVSKWEKETSSDLGSLELVTIRGKFLETEIVKSVPDSAGNFISCNLDLPDNYDDIELEDVNSEIDDNMDFEREADKVIDFTEHNPFSEDDY